MNIRKLKIFYATATSLNMTKVAKELYISQPSVSQAIHEIEEEVGAILFDRIGKRIYLTDEGLVYLNYVRRILNLYKEASERLEEMSNMESGKIKVGASTTIGIYILPDIIRRFVEKHKGIEISLIIENTANIERLILENKVDFAFVEGKINSEEIIKEEIWKDELVLICSDKHPWKSRKLVSGTEIKNEKFIIRERGSGTREVIESYMQNNNIEYNVFMELGNTEAIKKSVEAKLGIGCISSKCVDNLEELGKLHTLKIKDGNIERSLLLIIHKDKFINNNIKEFIKFSYK
ncbi:LysR family transcriptional regulator [uncultured Clostridium sp.]|uniref:LysR family transcriptional regulator n=1 Tax=uncultured Clostridium sp. TaxID=59620 RepID=UPI0025F9B761|nr:LysR family transcriptional regulator [uncultured Clostridium sp.]